MCWSKLLALVCCLHCSPSEKRRTALPDVGPPAPHAATRAGAGKPESGLPMAMDAAAAGAGAADAAPPLAAGCMGSAFPIAFVSTRSPPITQYELYVMSLDGSQLRRIGRGGHFQNPVW